MNGAGSRNKGSRFERDVAKAFGVAFNGEDLRRVPLSGGLDIRCDIYNPFDDTFPYFIECKNRETLRFRSLSNGDSELYAFYVKNADLARLSYLCKKYKEGPEPVVVFKGGDFPSTMIMTELRRPGVVPGFVLFKNNRFVYHLDEFLEWCPKERLSK